MNMSEKEGNQFDLPDFPMGLFPLLLDAALIIGIKRMALVGGAVRDGILYKVHKISTNGDSDFDLVVEGSATALAKELHLRLAQERLRRFSIHEAYDTAEISVDGISIDIATARKEVYASPGQNPKVTPSNLESDLARRDFTVNSMALEINTANFIDPYGGIADLETRQLKFLHSKSVSDDPTRVIRAARYASRLGFTLSPQSLQQVKSTLKMWPWGWKHGSQPELAPPALASRLRMELDLMLNKEPWRLALTHLQEWGALVLLDKGLQVDQNWYRRVYWAKRLNIQPLTALISGATDPVYLATRLQLAENEQKLLAESKVLIASINAMSMTEKHIKWSPSQWCEFLERREWKPSAVALTITMASDFWRPMFSWWNRWRHIQSPISAQSLIKKGWEQGPELGRELRRLRLEQIDKDHYKK